MQEFFILIILYIFLCFYDYFVVWKNISINYELFFEFGVVFIVFDFFCYYVWGFRLFYFGDFVIFLDQYVRVFIVCYFWKI